MIGRYERPIPAASPERQRRLDLSASESENLSLREIRCPRCNYLIIKVYSDSIGHIRPNAQSVRPKIRSIWHTSVGKKVLESGKIIINSKN